LSLGFGLSVGYPIAYPYSAGYVYPYQYAYPDPNAYAYSDPSAYSSGAYAAPSYGSYAPGPSPGYPPSSYPTPGYPSSAYPSSVYQSGDQTPSSYPASAYPASSDPTSGGYPPPGYAPEAPESVGVQPGTASGGVSFEISPATAVVSVDGTRAGTVADFGPSSQPLALAPGRHRIEVRAAGYQTIVLDADVKPGEVTPYQGTMQALRP
jgi:hypothetical protein